MLRKIALAVFSGLILAAAFPEHNINILAYVAFIPLFISMKETTVKEAFKLSLLAGLAFFGAAIFWMRHVSWPGYFTLILILAIFFGLFGILFSYGMRRPKYAVIFLPACWVALEWARSNLFTGFGWVLLGHSQYLNTQLIQIADITGAYGVSFVIMAINTAAYRALTEGVKKSALTGLAAIMLFLAVLGYGYWRMNEPVAPARSIKISLIQGNIPQAMKWDPEYKEEIIEVYTSLTEAAGMDHPELIIWPETSLPGFVEDDALFERLAALAIETRAHLLIGAPSYREEEDSMYNTAFLISPDGKIAGHFDKIHLVPFGEYIPFEESMGFLRRFINKPIGMFKKGRGYTVLETDSGVKFGALICFEDIFSGLVRNFTKRGARLMVNMTNDAWFMKTGAPYQHAQSSVFRAVENRVPVVRAANTGLSCFIDSRGRITGAVSSNGEEIFVRGYKTSVVDIPEGSGPYSRFGDIFIILSLAIIICKIVFLPRM